MAKIELTGRLYWNDGNYRDGRNRINRRPYWIILIIDMAKIEITSNHIGFMLIIEILKTELTGSHILIMLIIEIAKIEYNRRPYWNYAIYRDFLNEN